MRFGTDGVRGQAGVWPIDPAGARRIGQAAARWARDRGAGRVVVGHDPRPSGEWLAREVVAGAVQAGAEVGWCGALSSPALAVAVAWHADAGVMVTASHNPAADNGFKVLGPGGAKPDDAQTAMLEAWLAEEPPTLPGGAHDLREVVLETYAEAFRRAAGDVGALAGKRLVLDLAHGGAVATRSAWQAAFGGAELVEVLGAGDGLINEGVGSEHPERLREAVLAHKADAGLAVDGDGDRCLLVDETGAIVPGDALAWMLARRAGLQAVAVTVMSNAALEPSLPGVRIVRTPVGDRHLAEAMRRDGLLLGVEDSGHALFGDGLPGGDGLLTGLRALVAATSLGATLSQAAAGFVPFPRALTKVRVGQRPVLEEHPGVQALEAEALRRLGGGRVYLRYSGTEPVLRVLVEGADAGEVQAVSAWLTSRCAEVLG